MKRFVFAFLGCVLWLSPAMAVDDRQVIELSKDQRDRVLTQMRGFLEAVQDIVLATSEGDMEAVKEAAIQYGMGHHGQPGQRGLGVGRMAPPEFRQMGRSTHLAFDELAQAAEFGPQMVLEDLGVLMSNCTGCHATFRLVEKP
ncbi:hypothetical protein V5T82_05570 [Magnetovibrio sp. PR-2]|uniref:hypothetical protein n=1 Tax=Magnetovibrio sp. PR-2 TaxID=3120356 RepID=UPI002FCE3552